MANVPSDIAKKIAGSKPSGGGTKYKDGKYELEVVELKWKSGHRGESFIACLMIAEATRADYDQPVGKNKFPPVSPEPSKPGTTFDVVCNTTTNDSAYGDIKAFLLSLFGADDATTTDDEFIATLQTVVQANQPCRGMRIGGSTYRTEIQGNKRGNAGNDYVGMNWHTRPNHPDDVKARRAAQEKVPALAQSPDKPAPQDPGASIAKAMGAPAPVSAPTT